VPERKQSTNGAGQENSQGLPTSTMFAMPERIGIAVLAAGIGWCLGWLSACVTQCLMHADESAQLAPGTRRLIADPLVQGGCAAAWAIAAWSTSGAWYRWVLTGALAVPLVQVTVTDLRHRYVYTLVAAVGIGLGIASGWIVRDGQWWHGAAGAVGGGLVFAVIYLLGRLLYRGGEPLARGDITIAAMVGAASGTCTGTALVYGVLVSGVFAVMVLLFRRSRHAYLPYGPGLCIGGLITLLAPVAC
jgi:hypothetical protein